MSCGDNKNLRRSEARGERWSSCSIQALFSVWGGELDLGLKECSICLGGKKRRNFKWEKEEEVH